MSYSVPSLLISQEFQQNAVFNQSPLSALIIGPNLTDVSTVWTNTATTTTISSVTDAASVLSALGDVSKHNPLGYAVLQAVQNANGAAVYYIALAKGTGTAGAYTDAAEETATYLASLALAEKGRYYGLVPLSQVAGVINAVVAHVNAESSPAKAHWRTCWIAPAEGTGSSTADKTASYLSSLTTTVGDGNGASANSNSGPRRVHTVFPPTYTSGTDTGLPGYYLAAGLAGLRSGSVPHQSLTRTALNGPSATPLTTTTYSESDLNNLAQAGVWIITQAPSGGACYTRHQLTSDGSSLNYREDSVVANVDSISFGLQDVLAPFVGVYNISAGVLLQIRAVIDGELNYRLTNTYTARAGNQLLGYKILSLNQNATYQDKLDVVIQLQVPYPMNYINVTLSI